MFCPVADGCPDQLLVVQRIIVPTGIHRYFIGKDNARRLAALLPESEPIAWLTSAMQKQSVENFPKMKII